MSVNNNNDHCDPCEHRKACISVSEVSPAFIAEQTILNPTWIEALEEVITNVGPRVPQNTIFLSPAWSPASTGAPYFTDLQSALAYLATQNPQPESPWTVVIYPGMYQAPQLNEAQDWVSTEHLVHLHANESHGIGSAYGPMCPQSMLDEMRLRRFKLERSVKSFRASQSMVKHDAQRDAQLKTKMTKTQKRAKKRSKDGMSAMAILTVPPNVTFHALAKYTVWIGDDLVISNANLPDQSVVAFENIIFNRSVTYDRQQVGSSRHNKLVNCDFVDLEEQGAANLNMSNTSGDQAADFLTVDQCSFFDNTSINLLMDGLVADFLSCRLYNNFMAVGSNVVGEQSVVCSLDAVDSLGATVSVHGSSQLRAFGSLPNGSIASNDTANVEMNGVSLFRLVLSGNSTMSGRVSSSICFLQDNATASIQGNLSVIIPGNATTLNLNGSFNNIGSGGIFNPTLRTFNVNVPSNTSTPITLNFGNSYSNNNYFAVATVVSNPVPADQNVVQITQRNVGNLQLIVSPARAYPMEVSVVIMTTPAIL